MKIAELLQRTSRRLEEAGRPTPRLDAEVILAHLLNSDRLALLKERERILEEAVLVRFQEQVERRARGEPVAYITGRKEFFSLDFEVNREVLIPRPETEILVEEVLKVAPPGPVRILDLGTGSGAIAVSLACELRKSRLVATDLSAGALATAARNAQLHGIGKRVGFVLGDLFSPLRGSFDIIVSNPPYIASGEFPLLPPGVRDYEPPMALIGGEDGLGYLTRIIAEAPDYLRKDGWLFLEIGSGQQRPVEEHLLRAGYGEIGFRCDYGGMIRVARARKGA